MTMIMLPLADISSTDIRVVAGVLAIAVLFVIIWRRKRRAAD